MSARNGWIGAGLVLLAAAAAAGVYGTAEVRSTGSDEVGFQEARPPAQPGQPPAGQAGTKPRLRTVNTKPLLTARRLVALGVTPEEQELAQQAVRLADHAVDLSFSEAMRQAAESRPELTPEMKALVVRKEKAHDAVESRQLQLQQLTRQLAAGGERDRDRDRIQEELEVVKAQLELDQDDLAEASESLERAGGDPQAQIRRLKEIYDAAQKEVPPSRTEQVDLKATNLLGRFRAWMWQRAKLQEIGEAAKETSDRLTRVAKRRDQLAQQVQQDADARQAGRRPTGATAPSSPSTAAAPLVPSAPAPAQPPAQAAAPSVPAQSVAAAPLVPSAPAPAQPSAQAAAPSVPARSGGASPTSAALPERKVNETAGSTTRRPSELRRRLVIVGKRLQYEQTMAEVYGSWKALAEQQLRAALHRLILGALWIALTLLAVFAGTLVVDRLFGRAARDKARMATLRGVVKLAVQLAGAVVVLFVIFGIPDETTTILGLAGAGLTVALKDFIVAFFGWFVLMGRNGIRVGDWVEIEGVGGEVAEITLLHTVLLETGTGTGTGHPTGRRVSFVNSYAIEGHYFDFTTSGQWTWDEVQIVVPPGQDPYPTIDGLQRLVEKETQANAGVAEQEWRKTTSRYRVQTFSATPGISVVPTSAGVELHVRYVTRAHERHETRRRLHLAALELLHKKQPEAGTAA